MPRRGDPEKIYHPQRAGVFMRLVSAERLDAFDAEHWIARWEREAEANEPAPGSQGYWDAAWRWIEENRRKHGGAHARTTAEGWNAGGPEGSGPNNAPAVSLIGPLHKLKHILQSGGSDDDGETNAGATRRPLPGEQ